MRLIIDIDENLYNVVQNEVKGKINVSNVWAAIANGIPYEERPQGEWIFNSASLTDDMIATYYCSICGKGAYSGHDNYCWNCGAEMRGDNND